MAYELHFAVTIFINNIFQYIIYLKMFYNKNKLVFVMFMVIQLINVYCYNKDAQIGDCRC